MSDQGDYAVGRGRPPEANRFVKGRSGNPAGRPRGHKLRAPYETVLGQKVTVREDGETRQMTAAEAFLLQVTRRGLEGDGAAGRAAMAAIEEARSRLGPRAEDRLQILIRKMGAPDSIGEALVTLRAGKKLDRCRPTARLVIEPWLIEMALLRLGSTQLTIHDQKLVWKAARTPRRIKWPVWWSYLGNPQQNKQ